MFGYVRAITDRLPSSEQERYEALYCGLCRSIGTRYGWASTAFLSYDIVFLVLLTAGSDALFSECRCPVRPWKKRACWQNSPAIDAAADKSIVLTWWQLQDKIIDGSLKERAGGRASCTLLHGAYRKATARCPEFDAVVRACMEQLRAMELQNAPSLDRPADTFARILQAAGENESGPRGSAVSQILYHVGRWIYLADAWDDLEEDRAGGTYNPFLARYGTEAEAHRDEARQTMDTSLGIARTAFSLLDWGEWEPLLNHILAEGLPAAEEAIFSGQWKKRNRKETKA